MTDKEEQFNCRMCRNKTPATQNYGCAFVGSGFCLSCAQVLWRELAK